MDLGLFNNTVSKRPLCSAVKSATTQTDRNYFEISTHYHGRVPEWLTDIHLSSSAAGMSGDSARCSPSTMRVIKRHR